MFDAQAHGEPVDIGFGKTGHLLSFVHATTDNVITIEGDKATQVSYMLVFRQVPRQMARDRLYVITQRWGDRLVRTDAGWLFEHRIMNVLQTNANPDATVQSFSGCRRIRVHRNRRVQRERGVCDAVWERGPGGNAAQPVRVQIGAGGDHADHPGSRSSRVRGIGPLPGQLVAALSAPLNSSGSRCVGTTVSRNPRPASASRPAPRPRSCSGPVVRLQCEPQLGARGGGIDVAALSLSDTLRSSSARVVELAVDGGVAGGQLVVLGEQCLAQRLGVHRSRRPVHPGQQHHALRCLDAGRVFLHCDTTAGDDDPGHADELCCTGHAGDRWSGDCADARCPAPENYVSVLRVRDPAEGVERPGCPTSTGRWSIPTPQPSSRLSGRSSFSNRVRMSQDRGRRRP
ncbi:nuclear transport factor 2 family protein [Streptomyces sp. ISL-22]|nr:nuclear transport factor 2 family protein [Streptomyces sp. ISL-24]MBT2434634.1 nuclear transport factor 2 family protein [Streptomyces sp. ISL-22]